MMSDYINYINGLNNKWKKYEDKRRVITRRVDKIEDKNDIKDFEIDTTYYKMKGPKVIKSYDFYDDWESNLPDDIQFPSKLPDDITIPNSPHYPVVPSPCPHYPSSPYRHTGITTTYATSSFDNESKFKKLQQTIIDHDTILQEIEDDLRDLDIPIYDIMSDEYTIDVYIRDEGMGLNKLKKMDEYFKGTGNIQYEREKDSLIATYPFCCMEGCK